MTGHLAGPPWLRAPHAHVPGAHPARRLCASLPSPSLAPGWVHGGGWTTRRRPRAGVGRTAGHHPAGGSGWCHLQHRHAGRDCRRPVHRSGGACVSGSPPTLHTRPASRLARVTQFVLRVATTLRDKPPRSAGGHSKAPPVNPFLPYDAQLFVCHLVRAHGMTVCSPAC
jgi:hypothetical protein